ncbi:filamentous hemagglutinin N-terminal domain-containing protein [Salmonella enterica subsp. enterica]|nr:filamentous hemagglutinin N-terminal domain-containing protein [Salmonella enterica subsp. enterica serovar Gaminara]
MNKIYRLKFDKRRNELVVVSEITAGMGKEKSTGHIADLSALSPFRKLLGTLTPLALLTGLIISLFPGMALANPDLPTGGKIVGGQGSISTSGNQMTIHQQTQNMATNWHSFDVGQNNTVQFVQPDSSSVALNRVTGVSGSQIMGTLKANGQVFILNPNGVLFGKDARVNVAGLVASTKNINTADFMKGQYTLSGSGTSGAQVINQGSLTTSKGGYIVLAGERVSNSGTVTTPGGKTVLAAGKTVTLQLDNGGLASVSVNGSVVNALVENRGLISATNGQVYLTAKGQDMLLNTVVNNSGTIEAKGLASRGGEIVLNGGDSGVVSQFGQLLADGLTGQGGKITLEGQNIHLAGSSLTSATGKTGGGEVYVGGGWQGKDSVIKNASKVVMDKAATVDVSATDAGNGGTAVLWSDDYTNFRGAVLAKGGAQSGNGGRVETSSHNNLQAFGDVNTSAPSGKGGEWLLDPMDVTIVTAEDNTSVTETGKNAGGAGLDLATDHVFSPSASGAQVSAAKISEQLNNGTSVTVDTHGDGGADVKGNITIATNVNITKNTGADDVTLTLLADNNIQIGNNPISNTNNYIHANVSISSTEGKLNLKLLAGNTVNDGSASVLMGRDTTIALNGGDFVAGSAQEGGKAAFVVPRGRNSVIGANNISIQAMGNEGMNTNALRLNASGNIDINASKVTSLSDYGNNITWGAGDHLTVNSGGAVNITANKTGNAGATTTLSGVNGVVINGQNGTVTMDGGDGSNITLVSSEGAVTVSGKVRDGSDGLVLKKIKVNTPKGKTTLDGTTHWGRAAVLTGLTVNTGGDVNISGIARNLDNGKLGTANTTEGLRMTGSNITVMNGNVSVSGLSASGAKTALKVDGTDINALKGKVLLDGKSEGNADNSSGMEVTGSNLSSAILEVKGVSVNKGVGFSLTDSHLGGGLVNLQNVTFSSEGSGISVKNLLDSSVVTADNSDSLMKRWHPDNMTQVDLGGQAIFNDSTTGWVADYSSEEHPYGGWILGNTSVTAGGDVSLKGVGFSDSEINLSAGSLDIDNRYLVLLKGTSITVDDGSVSIHSGAGGIRLTGGSAVSAKNDVSLISDNGSVLIVGSGSEAQAKVTSAEGNILVNGTSTGTMSGVRFLNVSMTAENADGGGIDVYANSKGYFDDYQEFGSLYFAGKNDFNSPVMNFTGENTGNENGSGVAFVYANNTFNGDATISGSGGKGVSFRTSTLNFDNGKSEIKAVSNQNSDSANSYFGAGAIFFDGWSSYVDVMVSVVLNNADLKVSADSSQVHSSNSDSEAGVGAFSMSGVQSGNQVPGMKFSGNGNVSLIGKADDGSGVEARYFDNTDLNGKLEIEGTSNSGAGVTLNDKLNVNLKDATIKGVSTSSAGVNIFTGDGKAPVVNLGNNKITGESETGSGVVINGKNVTITNGALTGTVTSGEGAGISLLGGENYILDGVEVAGKSAGGTGVSVSGALTVNNGTTVDGTSYGSGAGVSVSGTLTTTSGDGVTLKGKSDSGDGVLVVGDTSLMGATVSGESVSGIGTNINGELTVSGTSDIKGTSTSGTGLNVAEKVTVTDSEEDKVTLTGTSTDKAGVVLGNSVSNITIKGSSRKGNGVELLSTASVSGGTLTATSVDGTGLQAEQGSQAENVDISAQTVNGQAIGGNNNALTTKGNTSISTVGEPGNTGIAENITPVPGSPTQDVAEALGKKLSESINMLTNTLNMKFADLSGLQQSWLNLKAQLDQAGNTGAVGQPDLKRLETVMNGLGTKLSVTGELNNLQKDISSLNSDAGTLGERLKKADAFSTMLEGVTLPAAADISAVGTELGAAKELHSATASLQGDLTARLKENENVRHLLDSLKQQLKDAQEKGTAGGAVLAAMQTQLEGLDLQQRSYVDELAHIRQHLVKVSLDESSPVTSRQESVNGLQTALSRVSGVSDMQVSALDNQLQKAMTGYARLVATAQGQAVVNAQTPLQNQDQQDGFHAGGEPPVPVNGYQSQPKNVDIRLCDNDGCRSMALDAGKPSLSQVAASTESR